MSNASISSDERAPSASPSDASDLLPSSRRPVSSISTQSSGYGSSRDDYPTLPQLPAGSSDIDPNQNPSPADPEGLSPKPSTKSCSFVHSKNNLNKGGTPNRASSRRQPFISATMAPNPQLTYLDRVVMEIIESERMYVRDLRMIVDVSQRTPPYPQSYTTGAEDSRWTEDWTEVLGQDRKTTLDKDRRRDWGQRTEDRRRTAAGLEEVTGSSLSSGAIINRLIRITWLYKSQNHRD